MVRARRIGAKEKLANAQEEIARLKAELADPQRTADEFVADAPGDGIRILGLESDAPPKVTGGMTLKEQEEKAFGKKTWIKVIEAALPNAHDVHQVASWCRNGQYVKLFRANTEVLLPESEIQKLENECVITDKRQVDIGEGGMEMANAKALNAGMEVERDQYGQHWLVRRQRRFYVQRLRPEQESLVIA